MLFSRNGLVGTGKAARPSAVGLLVLHQVMSAADPDILPVMQLDKGGIRCAQRASRDRDPAAPGLPSSSRAVPRRFIMNGADVMAPGLVSKGGHMDDVASGAVVVCPRLFCARVVGCRWRQ